MAVYYFHKNYQKTLSLNDMCINRRVHPTTTCKRLIPLSVFHKSLNDKISNISNFVLHRKPASESSNSSLEI